MRRCYQHGLSFCFRGSVLSVGDKSSRSLRFSYIQISLVVVTGFKCAVHFRIRLPRRGSGVRSFATARCRFGSVLVSLAFFRIFAQCR